MHCMVGIILYDMATDRAAASLDWCVAWRLTVPLYLVSGAQPHQLLNSF